MKTKFKLRFLRDNEIFNKGQEMDCERIPNKMNYGNGKSYAGVYRVEYIIKKTKFIDLPFEFENDLYEIIEILDEE